MKKLDEASNLKQTVNSKKGSRMKAFFAAMRRLAAWVWGKTPSLEKAQAHTDTWSGRLGWIAIILALTAGLGVFCLVMLLALLPYITVTHTLWAGLALGIAAGCFAYFLANKPAEMVGTASRALWWTRLLVRLGERFSSNSGGNPKESPAKDRDKPANDRPKQTETD
jgi:hypothetical protein